MNESSIKQQPDRLDLSCIIKAVDRFEDQVEDRAYEELVPLHVKLALEDKVFGWSHLSSSIVGHVLITIGAYYLSYLSLGSLELWDLQHFYATDVLSAACSIRTIISLVLALATFRFVRRRRYIWLRAPYGSSYYESEDQQRRKEVAETDYSTLLGHLRRRREVYLSQRVQQELSEAEVAFDSWKQKKDECQNILSHSSFQTFPTNKTTSIENDQVLFSPIKNMPYSHGGFFGAAPFMLANPDWITILRRLLPDVYVEISRRVLNAPARSLMHWAENNPVVAAYGTANELAKTGRVVNLEWDVFLDPRLVRRVEVALEQQEDFITKNGTKSASWSTTQKALFKFLEAELERRSSLLVDKMLIAHGNLTQLLLEQTGKAKDYNYSRVKRTRRTLGGGMYARQWVAIYAEALELGMQMATLSDAKVQQSSSVVSGLTRSDSCPSLVEESDYSDSSLAFNAEDMKETSISLCDNKPTCLSTLSSSPCPERSIEESIVMLRQVTNQQQPIGLVLDLKSRHVSQRIWSIVVNKLTAAGVHVEGVASFVVDEIRGINSLCDKPLTEFAFCHSAGDMQQACHDGRIAYGDTVLFNGGSLLWETPELTKSYFEKILLGNFDSATEMNQYGLLPFCKEEQGSSSSIKAYKEKLNLKIGIYVQEFGIDEAALNILVKLVNENPNVFAYGLSWGGINGVTVRGIQPGRYTCTDGFHTQRYAGSSWNSNLSAESIAPTLMQAASNMSTRMQPK
jgi:hypothetical protein